MYNNVIIYIELNTFKKAFSTKNFPPPLPLKQSAVRPRTHDQSPKYEDKKNMKNHKNTKKKHKED